MRGKKTPKRKLEPDLKYQSVTVSKFINKIMLRGQKETARKLIYNTFDILKEKTAKEPLEVFEQALKNASPLLEVKPRRIGGATYQVPTEISPERRQTLAMRWIIKAARAGKGSSFDKILAEVKNYVSKSRRNKIFVFLSASKKDLGRPFPLPSTSFADCLRRQSSSPR